MSIWHYPNVFKEECMRRLKIVYQHDEKDCGAACLKIICQYWGSKISIAKIKQDIKIDNNGSNFWGIINAAEKYGIKAIALKGSSEEFFSEIKSNEIPLPCIARIINKKMYEHFIVISKISNSKVHYVDPDFGRCKMSYEKFSDVWSGQIIMFVPGDDYRKINAEGIKFRNYFKYITNQPKMLVNIFLLSIAIASVNIIATLVFQYLIDEVLGKGVLTIYRQEWFAVFIAIGIGLIFLFFTKIIWSIWREKLLLKLNQKIELPLIEEFFEHMVELPMSVLSMYKTGEILSRIDDISKIRFAISNISFSLMMDVMMAIVCGGVLLYQAPVLFVIMCAMIFVCYAINIIYRPFIEKSQKDVLDKDADLNSYYKETIDGIQTIKIFSWEKIVEKKTKAKIISFQDGCIRSGILNTKQDSIIEFISSLSNLIFLWMGTIMIIEQEMTLGALMSISALLGYFTESVGNLLNLQTEFLSAKIATERLGDLMDSVEESKKGETFENGDIKFENIKFRYGNRNLILKDLDFSIKRGSKIAFIGKSGCGKTTIANLLIKLYEPECGTISIGERNILSISTEEIRKQILYVTQQSFFFSDTIKNNLFCEQTKSEDEIKNILDLCGCSEFIEKLPFGIETVLEENAANLSGGQKQKLAIARALLRKPKILVLDEATSQLDTVSEKRLQEILLEKFPHITCIMIAHRMNSIKQCDCIYVFDQGRLVEEGTHDELIRLKKCYYELWKAQQ